MKFTELNLAAEVLEGIDAMNFQEMTPVQEKTIPLILEGHDLIACAQTGTGKTAAFLLPILSQLRMNPSAVSNKIKALVIVPTRELSLQIDQQVEGFSYFCEATSVAVYGGSDSSLWDLQKNAILEGADIMVATPGRLMAHMKLGYVDFSAIQYLILDEADRMLDMGFYEDISLIVKELPKNRQTLMFSATMPAKIRKLAHELLQNPKEVSISISKPNAAIHQSAYMVYDGQKIELLCTLLSESALSSVVVFTSTKIGAKQIAARLQRLKVNARDIHSDLDQKEREDAVRQFRAKNVQVLVATDILARGIDIDDIELVVNIDVPKDPEDYVHRIGRTARANSKGAAITFITENDQDDFKRIEDMIERIIPKNDLPEGFQKGPEYAPGTGSSRNQGRRGKGTSYGNDNAQNKKTNHKSDFKKKRFVSGKKNEGTSKKEE